MKNQEPKKHHYIPQFILKNFNDENIQVNYWDIKNSKLEKRNTKSVFMNKNMYRDEELNEKDPTQIESKLSVFESEIADILLKKVLNKNEIILSRSEVEKLRIFMELLSFRSNLRMEQYKKSKFDTDTEEILKEYQTDGDFEKLWKKQLNVLATCRNFKEIKDSNIIDPIIKRDFMNCLEGYYMTIIDARGGEFLLSDIYPTCEIYPTSIGNIYLHYLFPISPTRIIILNHIMFKDKTFKYDPFFAPMYNLSQIKGDSVTPPKTKYINGGYNDQFIYSVKRIYKEDVEYMNSLILNESKVGIIFHNKEKILDSIAVFNSRSDTKQKYEELEEILNI